MYSVTFLILVCLGPLSVTCKRWTPETVLSLSQQCIDLKQGFDGACEIDPSVRNVCARLHCAKRHTDGSVDEITVNKRAATGTICGENKACKDRTCIPIDKLHVPRVTDTARSIKCNPVYRGWPPREVGTLSKQCVDLGKGYSGACKPAVGKKAYPCSQLRCALPNGDGTYKKVTEIHSASGTVCGERKACKTHACVDIGTERLPDEKGNKELFTCTEESSNKRPAKRPKTDTQPSTSNKQIRV